MASVAAAQTHPRVLMPTLPPLNKADVWVETEPLSDATGALDMMALKPLMNGGWNIEVNPFRAELAPSATPDGFESSLDLDVAPFALTDSPRAPWARADSADSLYRVARESLNEGEYRRAADLFAQIGKQYPTSQYRADATYWQAFALYRIGGISDLHEALHILDSARTSSVDSSVTSNGTDNPAADVAGNTTIRLFNGSSLQGKSMMIWARRSDNESAVLAMRIRSALSARGDATAAAQIARTAGASDSSCDPEDTQLRIEAFNALVQIDPKNAEPTIARVLARRNPCAASLRRGAIVLLARSKIPQNTDLLISTARNDPAIEVRAEAIRWLSQSSDSRATTELSNIATSSTNPALQRIAVRSLAVQDSPAARQAVRNIMTRTDVPNDIRITALHYAGKSDVQINDLSKMYDVSADRDTRREIISLLSQRSEPEASDKLISIARTSTDPALRRSAIGVLSRKKDPRTAKLLMDIIDK
jgi:HEAT repeat protein